MFEQLTGRFEGIFRRLKGKGKLSEQDLDAALREVRLALLEADVSLKAVREFTAQVRERAIGAEVMQSLTPAQQVIKIVHEELSHLIGTAGHLNLSTSPATVLLVGLQGSGKTTTAGKLALHLRRQGRRPLLVATDIKRPAAVQQLVTLGKQVDIPVYQGAGRKAEEVATGALRRAREAANDVVIVDTAGRLHIDEDLMAEAARLRQQLRPSEVLLVADTMTGQDAVRIAEAFHQQVGLTGLILTKADGDARGGAILSMRAVTGVPIVFLGMGEKLDALEVFYPDRVASRILGMGDVLTVIERAQAAFDGEQAKALERKLRTATFNLEDFLAQLQQVKQMGPLSQIIGMIPGLSQLTRQLNPKEVSDLDERQLKRVEAIIRSMTPKERHRPEIIDGSRRRRIARGSGTSVQDVNQLLNQFRQIQRMMKTVASGRGPRDPMAFFR
ncbi:MAG: signal recognition particle protein [Chloroflexi bacterium]|nr:signal recognition particle protein [Chloroflexota bacterium]